MHLQFDENKSQMSSGSPLDTLVVLIVMASIFMPRIPLTSAFTIALDEVLVLFVLPFLYLLSRSNLHNGYAYLFFGYIFSTVFSTIYGYTFFEIRFSERDLLEIIRNSRYIFIILYVACCNHQILVRHMNMFFVVGSYFVVVIAFLQYTNMFDMGRWLGKLYSTEHHTLSMLTGSKRVVVTGGDPNTGAAVVIYFFVYNYVKYIVFRKTTNVVLVALLGIAIILTSSRTGIIASALPLVLGGILLGKNNFLPQVLVFALVGLGVIYIIPKMEYIVVGLDLALKGENTSMENRYQSWEMAYYYFKQSPFFGWGPAKSDFKTVVDGEYFLVLRRYGAIGFILLMTVIYYVPLVALSRLKSIEKNDNYVLALTLIFYSASAMVIMLTNNFFHSYKLFTLYVTLASLVYFLLAPRTHKKDRANTLFG